jgi:hypothetical protein
MPKMSAEALKRLATFNSEQSDWYTKCPICGSPLRGTIKELKAHNCGADDDEVHNS